MDSVPPSCARVSSRARSKVEVTMLSPSEMPPVILRVRKPRRPDTEPLKLIEESAPFLTEWFWSVRSDGVTSSDIAEYLSQKFHLSNERLVDNSSNFRL